MGVEARTRHIRPAQEYFGVYHERVRHMQAADSGHAVPPLLRERERERKYSFFYMIALSLSQVCTALGEVHGTWPPGQPSCHSQVRSSSTVSLTGDFSVFSIAYLVFRMHNYAADSEASGQSALLEVSDRSSVASWVFIFFSSPNRRTALPSSLNLRRILRTATIGLPRKRSVPRRRTR